MSTMRTVCRRRRRPLSASCAPPRSRAVGVPAEGGSAQCLPTRAASCREAHTARVAVPWRTARADFEEPMVHHEDKIDHGHFTPKLWTAFWAIPHVKFILHAVATIVVIAMCAVAPTAAALEASARGTVAPPSASHRRWEPHPSVPAPVLSRSRRLIALLYDKAEYSNAASPSKSIIPPMAPHGFDWIELLFWVTYVGRVLEEIDQLVDSKWDYFGHFWNKVAITRVPPCAHGRPSDLRRGRRVCCRRSKRTYLCLLHSV